MDRQGVSKLIIFFIVLLWCTATVQGDDDDYMNDGIHGKDEDDEEDDVRPPRFHLCPEVRPMKDFNIFRMLGAWDVVQYYSSAEEALTYHCMRVHFNLSNGNMDMLMTLTYRFADDPNDESQAGNITWQIPDPRRPEHWRHTEDHCKLYENRVYMATVRLYMQDVFILDTGVYNTDVVDTDHDNWLLLLHCSDPESSKKFLSTFILGRSSHLDETMINYLREKVSQFDVDLDYLFPVNQTHCLSNPTTTQKPLRIGRQVTTTTAVPRRKKSRRSRDRLG